MSGLMPSDSFPGTTDRESDRESADRFGETSSRHTLRQYLCQTNPSTGPFLLLAGPPGSGKTAMVRDVIEALNEEAGDGSRRALLEVHLPGNGMGRSAHSLLPRLRSLVQQSIRQGRQPVLFVDNLPSPDDAVPLVDRLRQELPAPATLVGATTDLTAVVGGAVSGEPGPASWSAWKPVLHAPTLSAWEAHQRAPHVSPPHPDLLDMAVLYLRRHPSDAWPGALAPLSGGTRAGGSRIGTAHATVPSPRDWTLAREDHARLLRLAAEHGDGGEWGSYLAEIYQRYLSAPVGSRFLEFFGQQPLPSTGQILLEGEPPRLGWRHPLTLPDLADDIGRVLPDVLDGSRLKRELPLAEGSGAGAEPARGLPAGTDRPEMYPLSRFGGFLNDLVRYGQYLSGAPVNTHPAAGADLLLPEPSGSRSALVDRMASALRPAVPLIRERLEPLVASGLALPAPLSRFMEVTSGAGGITPNHSVSIPPPFRSGFHR